MHILSRGIVASIYSAAIIGKMKLALAFSFIDVMTTVSLCVDGWIIFSMLALKGRQAAISLLVASVVLFGYSLVRAISGETTCDCFGSYSTPIISTLILQALLTLLAVTCLTDNKQVSKWLSPLIHTPLCIYLLFSIVGVYSSVRNLQIELISPGQIQKSTIIALSGELTELLSDSSEMIFVQAGCSKCKAYLEKHKPVGSMIITQQLDTSHSSAPVSWYASIFPNEEAVLRGRTQLWFGPCRVEFSNQTVIVSDLYPTKNPSP